MNIPTLKTAIRILLSLALGFVITKVVFQIGGLARIMAYSGSEQKLAELLQATTLVFFTVYAVAFFFLSSRKVIFSFLFLGTALLVAFFIPFLTDIQFYKVIGDYLRDVQGINIYFLDYSRWVLVMFLLEVPLLTLIFLPVVRSFMKTERYQKFMKSIDIRKPKKK